jgi:predicted GNAT family acetyltransferase
MKVRRYVNAVEFLERVQDFLEEDEAANSLPLGILLRLAQRPQPSEGEERPFFALAEEQGHVPFVMLMTPPHNMIVHGGGKHLDAAINAAIPFLLRENVFLPGVIGPPEVATRFASLWGQSTGCTVTVQMEQMLYRLDRVNEIALSPGELIRATEEHIDLAADWMIAFSEVTPDRLSRGDAQKRAEEAIAASRLYLWRDEVPVSKAWKTRPTRNGIVVSGVYTPLASRNCGYATSCVASLSRLLLEEGYRFCTLYADLSNPISNHVYKKIGYRPIRASIMHGFGSLEEGRAGGAC